jgi:rfaE bifunctional protein kinase chain/domain
VKKNGTRKHIEDILSRISKEKVLVIGDTIIDKYSFVQPKGRAVKDPILSAEFVNEEVYAGGALAIAKHISSFVGETSILTVLGDKMDHLDFIKNDLPSNIDFQHFTRENSPTTVKKRYVDSYRKSKLFKVEYIKDEPIESKLESKIISKLNSVLPNYDVVIVGDFGHGMLTEKLKRVIEKKSNFLSVNVQSNSSNMGFNYVPLYKRSDFIAMNENEIRLPVMMRFEPIDEVMRTFAQKFQFQNFLLTLGKKGSVYYNNSNLYNAPAFSRQSVDTVGAGDASFAIASLFVNCNANPQVIPAIANCAAAIKITYMGNKNFVTKDALLKKLGDYDGLG